MNKKYGMRKLFFLILVTLFFYQCSSNQNKGVISNETSINNVTEKYDSIKAKNFGADKYGMKKYVMAFLKKGPNTSIDSLEAVELQIKHLNNITKMAEEGKLVLAGPFLGGGEFRGIYIFNVPTIQEAKKLCETDPAIKKGSLSLELKEWYGSAALVGVNKVHKTLAKKQITEN